VESCHKAMIVISHPWEFVPKGNSHFNYHTGSNNNNNVDSNSEKNSDNNTEMLLNSISQANLQQQQFPKNSVNGLFQSNPPIARRRNPSVIISDDERWKMDKDCSFGELSYGLPNKSPFLNNMNCETLNVSFFFNLNY